MARQLSLPCKSIPFDLQLHGHAEPQIDASRRANKTSKTMKTRQEQKGRPSQGSKVKLGGCCLCNNSSSNIHNFWDCSEFRD